jgi:hypothetical protein
MVYLFSLVSLLSSRSTASALMRFFNFLKYLALLSIVFICRSSWILWLFMYQRAFRMDRRVSDWKRWRISLSELEAIVHSWILYVYMGLSTAFYRRGLPSFRSLIPFLPLFCSCQFRWFDSVQFLCSQANDLSGWRLETRLDWTTVLNRLTLIYNHFTRATQKTQRPLQRRRVYWPVA